MPAQALAAFAARRDETKRHAVTDPDRGDPVAYGFDHTCPFVTEDGRKPMQPKMAEGQVQIRVAYAGCGHRHQHLTRARVHESDVFDPAPGVGLQPDGSVGQAFSIGKVTGTAPI